MTASNAMRRVTVVLEVNQDAEDDVPIADAVRWSLEGAGCAAIDPKLGERVVSIDVTDAALTEERPTAEKRA